MQVIKLTVFSNEFTISNTEDLCSYPPSAEVCHRRCFPAAASEVHQVGIMQSQDADTSTCLHQLQSKIHLETSKQKVKLLMIQKNTAFFNFASIYLLTLCYKFKSNSCRLKKKNQHLDKQRLLHCFDGPINIEKTKRL